jgi:exopolyphosphatase/guanosine-5'-triphosphate,3'-diphosphate pyrophosphatase
MPGFSTAEKELLALWIRNQRKKIHKEEIDALDSKPLRQKVVWLLALLRLAIILSRDRRTHPIPFIMIDGQTFKLLFDEDWLDKHPLSRLDLQQEAHYLERLNIKLVFN